MKSLSIVLAILVLAMLGGAQAVAVPDDGVAHPPRYRLEPGQVLVYEGGEVLEGQQEPTVERRAELRVVGQATGGGRRLVVTHRHQRFVGRGDQRRALAAREDVYVIEVAPDGTIARRGEDSMGNIDRLLPALPADAAEAANGWTFSAADVQYACVVPAADGPAASRWRFTVTPFSHRDELNGFSEVRTYELDPQRGVIADLTVDHFHEGRKTRTGFDRLVGTRRLEEAARSSLERDAQRYVDAERGYRRTVAHALGGTAAGVAPKRLEDALAALVAVRSSLESELLGGRVDAMIAQHRASGPAFERRIGSQGRLVGRPAPDWDVLDLEGRRHRLADYHGTVLVLDFWYRNCGWCVRAMPQLDELALRYAGRPVAVLGMNVDRDPADARYVAQRLELGYPTLLAGPDLARAHAVGSYPTLVIVDAEGVLRYVHVGYSGTLVEELSPVIDGLLGDT